MCFGWIAGFALIGDLPVARDIGGAISETGLLTAWLPSTVGVIYYHKTCAENFPKPSD
jgi:hypothetical protein